MKTLAIIQTLLLLGAACSESSDKLTQAQIEALASEAMQHTPEHTHSACLFHWVLYVTDKDDAFPEITRRIKQELQKKYTVYTNKSEIPAASIYEGTVGQGYDGGFEFSVQVKRLESDIIEVQYGDFEDPLAASSQTIRYRWEKGKWKIIWKSDMMVS